MSIGSLNRIRQTLINAQERTGADVDLREELGRAILEIEDVLLEAVTTKDVDDIVHAPRQDFTARLGRFMTDLRTVSEGALT